LLPFKVLQLPFAGSEENKEMSFHHIRSASRYSIHVSAYYEPEVHTVN
jgi:hypothetical protein